MLTMIAAFSQRVIKLGTQFIDIRQENRSCPWFVDSTSAASVLPICQQIDLPPLSDVCPIKMQIEVMLVKSFALYYMYFLKVPITSV